MGNLDNTLNSFKMIGFIPSEKNAQLSDNVFEVKKPTSNLSVLLYIKNGGVSHLGFRLETQDMNNPDHFGETHLDYLQDEFQQFIN